MTLTKHAIANTLVCNEADLSKVKSAEFVDSCLEIIKTVLESGEDILIRGFGKFYVKNGNNKRRTNVPSGNHVVLDAKRIVIFKASNVLINKINPEL